MPGALLVLGLSMGVATASNAAPQVTQADTVLSATVATPAAATAVSVPGTAAKPAAVAAVHGPLHGARYFYQTICIEKRTEFWPIANAAQFFEDSGAVDFIVSTNCSGYLSYQRLIVDDYAAADGTCSKTQATSVQYAGLPYRTWASTPVLWMNAYYATCFNTPTRKAHMISRGIGYLGGGLQVFIDASLTYPSVMNDATPSVNSVAWAQAFDRNGVWEVYLGASSKQASGNYHYSTTGKGVTSLPKFLPPSTPALQPTR